MGFRKSLFLFLRGGVVFLSFFFLEISFSFSEEGQAPGASQDSPYEEMDHDSYDPFVDYSEFDQTVEEEEDMNFFVRGRFLTLGFVGGYRFFSKTLGEITKPGWSYGIFFDYFFNLNFALQLGFISGSNAISFDADSGFVQGSFHLTDVHLNLKYYFDPKRFVRRIADLNPYICGGFSQVRRTTLVSISEDEDSPLSIQDATQFNFGAGIEVPLIRKKAYIGIQAFFHFIQFPDEKSEIVLNDGTDFTGLYPDGDIWSLKMALGINF